MAGRPPPLLQRPSRLHHVLRGPPVDRHNPRRGDTGTSAANRPSQLDRRVARVLQTLRRTRNPHPQDARIRVVERPSEIQEHLARVQRILRRSANSRQEDDADNGVASRTSQLDRRLARVEQVLRRSRNSRPDGAGNRVVNRSSEAHRRLAIIQVLRRHRNPRSENTFSEELDFRLVENPSEIDAGRVQLIRRHNRTSRERAGASNRDADGQTALERRADHLRLRLLQRRLRMDRERREARRGASDLPLVIWQMARIGMRERGVRVRPVDRGNVAARRAALQRRLARLQQVLRRDPAPLAPRHGVARRAVSGGGSAPHRRRPRLLLPETRRLGPQHDMDFDELLAEYQQIAAVQVTLRRQRELRLRELPEGDLNTAEQVVARLQVVRARLLHALGQSDDQQSQEVLGNAEIERDLSLDEGLARFQEFLRGANNQRDQDISGARDSALHQYRDRLQEDFSLTDDQQYHGAIENDILERDTEVDGARLLDATRPLVDQQSQETYENEILDRNSEDVDSLREAPRGSVHEQNRDTIEDDIVDGASVEDIASLQEALRRSVDQQNQDSFENEMVGGAREEDGSSLQVALEAFETEILERASVVDTESLPVVCSCEAFQRSLQAFGSATDDRASESNQGAASLQEDSSLFADQRNQEYLENEMVDRGSLIGIASLGEALRRSAEQQRSEADENFAGVTGSALSQRVVSLQDTIRDIEVPPPVLVADIAPDEDVSVLSRRHRWRARRDHAQNHQHLYLRGAAASGNAAGWQRGMSQFRNSRGRTREQATRRTRNEVPFDTAQLEQQRAARRAMAQGAAALRRSFASLRLELHRAPLAGLGERGRELAATTAIMQGRAAQLAGQLGQLGQHRPMPGQHRVARPRVRRHRRPGLLAELGVASPGAAWDRRVARLQEAQVRSLARGGGGRGGTGGGARLPLLGRLQVLLRRAHGPRAPPTEHDSS